MKKSMTLTEVSRLLGIDQIIVIEMIQQEWVHPVEDEILDDEDIARIQLIMDLRHQFGANDESIPLILHLVDQLYYLRNQLGRLRASE